MISTLSKIFKINVMAAALLASNMVVAQVASPAGSARVEPANDLTPSILYQVLAAEIAAQRGQLGTAASTYLALAKSTRDSRLAKRATEIFLGERVLDGALQSATLWAELAPNDEAAANTLEALYITAGRLTVVEPLLAKRLAIVRETKDQNALATALNQSYASLERLLVRAPDKRASFDLIERLSKPDLAIAGARSALSTMALNAGMIDRAAAESLAASRLQPDSEGLAVNAAALSQQSTRGAKGGIEILKPFIAKFPKSTEARITYGRLLAIDGQTDAAKAQLEQVLKDDSQNPAILYSLAQVAYQLKQPELTKKYLDQFIALPPSLPRDNNAAFYFQGQLAEESKNFAVAIDWYAKVQRGEQYMSALTRRALLLGKVSRVEDARALLQSISPINVAERRQLTSAEAAVLRQSNKFDEAFAVLDAALTRTPNDPDLLYEQGMAAEKINKLDVMEKSIRKLIQLEPLRAEAYNALGYTFAERNLRLPEALALIERAVQLSPENGQILDSMGWVLFKLNRLPEALDYLQRAFKLSPDAEIAVHIGEVLWKQGKQDEAKVMWRDAKQKEPNSEVLKETLARLNAAI